VRAAACAFIVSAMVSTACRNFDPSRTDKDETGSFASCCDGFGTCLPAAFVPSEQAAQAAAAGCADALVCVPDALLQSGGLHSCTATAGGGEGRCLPACLIDLAAESGKLFQDDCPAHQLCAPCFEPLHGQPTGACSIGKDPGPVRPPSAFASCCGELGRCVPAQLVAEVDRTQLGQASCTAAELCAPAALLEDAQFVPASCVTSVGSAEGRCLPACLPGLAQQAERLFQDGCPEHEQCAPCFDPLDGSSTGACQLGGDPGPRQAPVVLPRCCGELGRCLPERAVSESDRKQLERAACSDGSLCTPTPLLGSAEYVPQTCRTPLLGAEGRCLPACLPALARRSEPAALDCPAEHGCAPCFDPVEGSATGACALGADVGPSEPAKVLAACCGDQGRCLPESRIKGSDREQLARAQCQSGELCTPRDFVANPAFVPKTCKTRSQGAEGRCLPGCLPALTARKDQLSRDDCPAEQLCAPCFDPLDGTRTGACQLAGDPGPATQPIVLGSCCNGLGRCVGEADVQPAQRSALAADSCQAAQLCSPAEYVADASFVAQRCHDPATHAEGRCLLTCLPRVRAQIARLGVDVCADVERCVPCYDPVSGEPTDACTLTPADQGPSEPKRVFESCCPAVVGVSAGPSLGLCVPRAFLPEGAPSLPRLTCPDPDSVCAPRVFAAQDGVSLPKCTSPNTDSGACVPSCMLDASQRGLVLQGSCATETACVPCTALGSSTGACQ
jgi:hypothetical protein